MSKDTLNINFILGVAKASSVIALTSASSCGGNNQSEQSSNKELNDKIEKLTEIINTLPQKVTDNMLNESKKHSGEAQNESGKENHKGDQSSKKNKNHPKMNSSNIFNLESHSSYSSEDANESNEEYDDNIQDPKSLNDFIQFINQYSKKIKHNNNVEKLTQDLDKIIKIKGSEKIKMLNADSEEVKNMIYHFDCMIRDYKSKITLLREEKEGKK